MGYYIRILGTSDQNINISQLIEGLSSEGMSAKFEIPENESPEIWTSLSVWNLEGEQLIEIERNAVKEDELGEEELEELREEIEDFKPISAVKWLDNYFGKIEVIYAIQMLDASFEEANYQVVSIIKDKIWRKVGGILQADNEGFSNEEGNHILWQFSNEVTGDWNMAVLNSEGEWINFRMDLGNKKQRKEFRAGRVPKDVLKL